jgi:branched-chain amino acid transport system ATP-binding protein
MSLEVEGLDVAYGSVRVLFDLTVDVGQELVAVIGANGAGKTTLLRSISGLVKPTSGRIAIDGQSLVGMPPHKVVGAGIVHVPEGRHIFPGLTVDENLDMGAFLQRDEDVVERTREEVFDLFPRLRERRRQPGGTLSGGEQQMLAVGRGLMAKPKVLMLDEPSLGLAPQVVREIARIVARLPEQGISVLMVEQDARMALRVSDRAYVIVNGRVELSGPSEELLGLDEVQRAYLGA